MSALIVLAISVVAFIGAGALSSKINISLPFVTSAVVGGAVLAELFLPGSLLDAFPGSSSFAFLTENGAGVLAATAAVLIFAWWYARAWLIEGRDDAERATQSVVRQAENFAQTWFTTWRVIALGLVSIAALFLGEFASLLGEFPLAVANVATLVLGYFQLGGVVPWVGGVISTLFPSMTSEQWLVTTTLLFIVAVGVRNS